MRFAMSALVSNRRLTNATGGTMNPSSNDLSQSVDPVVEAYKRDIDWSLVRENLRKTPEERVLGLIDLIRLADEAQKAGRALR